MLQRQRAMQGPYIHISMLDPGTPHESVLWGLHLGTSINNAFGAVGVQRSALANKTGQQNPSWHMHVDDSGSK